MPEGNGIVNVLLRLVQVQNSRALRRSAVFLGSVWRRKKILAKAEVCIQVARWVIQVREEGIDMEVVCEVKVVFR